MTKAQLRKSFILTALLLNSVTGCMLSSEGPGFVLIPTSFGQSSSASNLPLLSTTSSLDEETAATLQAIQEENRRRQEYITRRDEVLRQVLPNVDRGSDSLANTIDQRFFSRGILLTELAGPIGPVDYLVSRLTVILERVGGGFQITPEAIQRIGQRFPNIRELELVNTNLQDEGLRVLSEQPYAQRLTTLDISSNNITQEGISALSRFTNLTSLNVHYNRIGDRGLEILSGLPLAEQLISLDISSISLRPDAVIYLNKFVNLKNLLIAGNSLGDQGLAMLAEQPIARRLTSLDISSNNITAQGIKNSLGSFTQLKNLHIGSNSIGDEGLAALAQLDIAPQLDALRIDSAGITLQSLRKSLKAFTALTSLVISANKLGDEALKLLSEMPFARNLTYLSLSFNGIKKATWEAYKNVFSSLKRPMRGLAEL